MSYTNIVSEVADYLEQQGVGTVGTDIFIGNLPNDITNGIMLVGTSGMQPEMQYDIFTQVIEIWTRNESTGSGFDKAQQAFDAVHTVANTTFTNAYIYFMHSLTEVEALGRDINGKALHKIQVKVIYRKDLIS